MPLHLENLDYENVRELMLNEFESDVRTGRIFLSNRLKKSAHTTYLDSMKTAIKSGDDDSCASQLEMNNCFEEYETKQVKGKLIKSKVPYSACSTLSEGEFNRFYLRGICIKAVEEEKEIEIYRAKRVAEARPDSNQKIGTRRDPATLLADLRTNIGANLIEGVPSGPNSGLSGKIVEKRT